jgi:anti-sigma regulatory factor (Ser/Thr protein kinase)
MGKDSFTSHRIEDRSYVAFVKREIHEKVSLMSFKESKVGEIDILVSELTSNLIKHAGSGELLYRLSWENERDVFEIFCLDKGPGMTDVPQMVRDGISTTNTLGQGLGAIQRLSDVSRIYSIPGWGTIVYAKVLSSPQETFQREKKIFENTVLEVPKPGEVACGDGHAIKELPGETCIFFGDGLGHGLYAQEAIQAAVRSFHQCPPGQPTDILRFINNDVKKTRGMVATVARLLHKEKVWQVCGIGNIHTRLFDGLGFKTFMSYNGIIGLNLPNTLNNHQAEAGHNQFLIMASDGLGTRWDLGKYPAIFKHGTSVVAAALYKDFCRGHDDSSVLAGKVTF